MPEIFKPHELPLHTLRGQVLSACGEVLADCRREEIAAQRCQRTAQLFATAPRLVEVLRRFLLAYEANTGSLEEEAEQYEAAGAARQILEELKEL